MTSQNDATRVLQVVRNTIAQNQKAGANIDVTYGQVFGLSSDGLEASVYLAGSRELATSDGGTPEPSDGFRVPSWMQLASGDYVRVSIDQRGHRWVDEYLPTSPYSRVVVDFASGQIKTGPGTSPPVNVLGGGGSFTEAASTDTAIDIDVTGDTNKRLVIDGAGKHLWGPGNAAGDTDLFRSGVGVLETTSKLKLGISRLVGSGTVFPAVGVSSDADLFYNTAYDLWFVFDAVEGMWMTASMLYADLGVQRHAVANVPLSATLSIAHLAPIMLHGLTDAYVDSVALTFQVASGGTALSGSHSWAMNLGKLQALTNTSTTIASHTVNSGSSGQWRQQIVPVNDLLNTSAEHYGFGLSVTKTGTPGDLYVMSRVAYRLCYF